MRGAANRRGPRWLTKLTSYMSMAVAVILPKGDWQVPKNEGKLDKDDLRPDVFLQTMEKSVSFFDRYRSLIVGLAILLGVGGFGYVILDYFNARSERLASEGLYNVEADYLKTREQFERARMEALEPTPKADGKEAKKEAAVPATGDLEKDYGKVVAGFEKFLEKDAKTAAAAQAALMLAGIYVEYKQPEKAISALDKVLQKLKPSELLYGLAQLTRGSALAAKGDCTQAIASWQAVAEGPSNPFLQPDALLKSGVCYESLKQFDKAAEMYRRINEKFSDTAAAKTAKVLLRALQIQQAGEAVKPTAG